MNTNNKQELEKRQIAIINEITKLKAQKHKINVELIYLCSEFRKNRKQLKRLG